MSRQVRCPKWQECKRKEEACEGCHAEPHAKWWECSQVCQIGTEILCDKPCQPIEQEHPVMEIKLTQVPLGMAIQEYDGACLAWREGADRQLEFDIAEANHQHKEKMAELFKELESPCSHAQGNEIPWPKRICARCYPAIRSEYLGGK